MDYRTQILRSKALSNVPERKLQEKVLTLVQGCKVCSAKNIKVIEQAFDGLCERCATMVIAYNRYADGNIPIGYWDLDMKDFKGSPTLKKVYDETIEGLSKMYQEGGTICFAGNHGIGKTMTT